MRASFRNMSDHPQAAARGAPRVASPAFDVRSSPRGHGTDLCKAATRLQCWCPPPPAIFRGIPRAPRTSLILWLDAAESSRLFLTDARGIAPAGTAASACDEALEYAVDGVVTGVRRKADEGEFIIDLRDLEDREDALERVIGRLVRFFMICGLPLRMTVRGLCTECVGSGSKDRVLRIAGLDGAYPGRDCPTCGGWGSVATLPPEP